MSSKITAGIVVAGNRRAGYAAQRFQGQPNRPEQAVRVFDVLCSCARNQKMRLPKCCLIIRMRV